MVMGVQPRKMPFLAIDQSSAGGLSSRRLCPQSACESPEVSLILLSVGGCFNQAGSLALD